MDSGFHSFEPDETSGLWCLSFPQPAYSRGAFSAFLADFKALLLCISSAGEKLELLVDLSGLGVPPSYEYVKDVLRFLTDTKSVRAECCGKTVIAVPSAPLRALISTVLFLEPPCRPVELVSSLDAFKLPSSVSLESETSFVSAGAVPAL